MQQEKPTDTTGVPISLDVVDANGNYRNIGTTVSDASGKFALTWTPDIEGDYAVIATFCGSESYYGSSDEAFFTAAAPPATPTPSPMQAAPQTDMYVVGVGVAIIIAIAIVGLVLSMMIKRRSSYIAK
jgi:hypothetical protein